MLDHSAPCREPERHPTFGGNLDSDEDSDSSSVQKSDPFIKKRAPRNSKIGSNHLPKPTQMAHYSGPWLDVLEKAKFNYRLYLHTVSENPFPQRGEQTLKDAFDCLLKAMAEHNHNPPRSSS